MKKVIKRLRLREGDILVVQNAETLKRLLKSNPPRPDGVRTSVPVVLAPEGIEQIPLEKLKELVARLEGEKNGNPKETDAADSNVEQ